MRQFFIALLVVGILFGICGGLVGFASVIAMIDTFMSKLFITPLWIRVLAFFGLFIIIMIGRK
jgi:hypothetical protein